MFKIKQCLSESGLLFSYILNVTILIGKFINFDLTIGAVAPKVTKLKFIRQVA